MLVLATLGAFGMAVAGPNSRNGFPVYQKNNEWNPTDAELVQLPEHCQRQFRPPPKVSPLPGGRSGPKPPRVKRTCPINMNHFCPGLVALNRAKNPAGSKRDRSFILSVAERELGAVMKYMNPTCARAQEVQSAYEQAKLLRRFVK